LFPRAPFEFRKPRRESLFLVLFSAPVVYAQPSHDDSSFFFPPSGSLWQPLSPRCFKECWYDRECSLSLFQLVPAVLVLFFFSSNRASLEQAGFLSDLVFPLPDQHALFQVGLGRGELFFFPLLIFSPSAKINPSRRRRLSFTFFLSLSRLWLPWTFRAHGPFPLSDQLFLFLYLAVGPFSGCARSLPSATAESFFPSQALSTRHSISFASRRLSLALSFFGFSFFLF